MTDSPQAQDAPVEALALAIRNGHPHDGSDLDCAVDDDAARYLRRLAGRGWQLVHESERLTREEKGRDG